MARRKYEFNEGDKRKLLLWCRRHCCLCGMFAGVSIEIAHLVETSSDIDDAMPLCFDCHTAIGHYNQKHPRGKKYAIAELKARREQVYEEQTSHLISPILCRLAGLPDVRFQILNTGDRHPVRLRIMVTFIQGQNSFNLASSPHYSGDCILNLNPGKGFDGHFLIPAGVQTDDSEPLRARIHITVIDIHEREHRLLPEGYIHPLTTGSDWYFEPSEQLLGTVSETSAESTKGRRPGNQKVQRRARARKAAAASAKVRAKKAKGER